MREVVFCETPDDVADAAADLIAESERAALDARGIFRIALSGGRTPGLLYERLASEEWENALSWEQWDVFWSDERAVPPTDPESNYGLAYAALLSRVPVGDVWRMQAETPDLSAAAADYARVLKSRFGPGIPEFDVLLLGMGPDGHVASLFPGHAALNSQALVEPVTVALPVPHRLTLTLPVINRARRVIVLVCGAEKSFPVRRVLEYNDASLPAAQVNPQEGECWWLLDEAASASLK